MGKNINREIKIGHVTLKNRLTMAPTVKFDYTDESAFATEKHVSHYELRAKGGIGLICVEATAVLPEGRFWKNHMGFWDDKFIEGHKKITDACHAHDVPVIIQLNHAGIFAERQGEYSIGPSTMEFYDDFGKNTFNVKGLSLDEVHFVQNAFVSAAVRAKKSGYDGIQLHGCHRYLINEFVSPVTNHREDEYGGSTENRARFAKEIISMIRNECGEDFLISIRTTGCDASLDDAVLIAEEYVKAGCDYLQVSTGFTGIDDMPLESPLKERCPLLGMRFKKHFKERVPVSCVGGIKTEEEIDFILDNDLTDTVDLGRSVLADPFLPAKIAEGKGSEIKKCYGCKACQYGPFTKHHCPFGNI